jgi:hypothetical protein
LQRQLEFRNDRAQAQENRMPGRRAGFHRVEFGLITRQQLPAPLRRQVAFVGEVVGAAGEAVDGGHRLAQRGRQQDRRNGEVLVMIDGHCGDGRQ